MHLLKTLIAFIDVYLQHQNNDQLLEKYRKV